MNTYNMGNGIGYLFDTDREWICYEFLPQDWRDVLKEFPLNTSSEEAYYWYKSGGDLLGFLCVMMPVIHELTRSNRSA